MQDYIEIIENSQATVKFILLLFTNVFFNAIGFIPSAFLTAINLSMFGTFLGTSLSLIGEVIGTQIGFYLYKLGVTKIKSTWMAHHYWYRVQNSSVKVVFITIIVFRLLPFVPSGIVTAGAAFTTIGKWKFMLASTIGKIPSVLIEVAIIKGLLQTFNLPIYSVILIFLCLFVFVSLFRIGKIRVCSRKEGT